MVSIQSPDGPTEVINARRTESLDAPNIQSLASDYTQSVFGRVNVVNLIEKAVLAVTLSNEQDELLGHAAFYDYPNVEGVDQAEWETWLNKYYKCGKATAINTLFMHYFVSKNDYSHGCAKEIIRTAFNAVPELHYCLLVVPQGVFPESALSDIFKPLDKTDAGFTPQGCVVFVCNRHDHAPVLHIRKARVQDHDDLTPTFNRQSDMLRNTYGDYFLAELIEAQDDNMHCLVAEVDGTAVGFMSVCTDVNLSLLNECFELGPYHGLRKPDPSDVTVPPKTPSPTPPPESVSEEPAEVQSRPSTAGTQKSVESKKEGSVVADVDVERQSSAKSVRSVRSTSSRASQQQEETRVQPRLSDSHLSGSNLSIKSDPDEEGSVKSTGSRAESVKTLTEPELPYETQASTLMTPKLPTPLAKLPKRFVPTYYGECNAFSIQLFCIDERFEMRSTDFLTKAFELFPQFEFVIITVPHLVPEFPLLQQFVRVTPRVPSVLPQELYVFNKSGLLQDFHVRAACSSDYNAVDNLVSSVTQKENLLNDLQMYNKARRDPDGTSLKAFVAVCSDIVVGIAIIRDEEDIEYIRSHYNIEDFIYYSHHRRDEHGHLFHFALNPIFAHLSKQFLKEVLRLTHKSCLYYQLYPGYAESETKSKHSLITCLNDMVPVRSRRQIVCDSEVLGINAPSERILKVEEPYALNHINRKLTLEPKVAINARIVVVGASDVGIGFLETLTFCPHLRFNNLTLISPHGLPGELPPDEIREQMYSSSNCYMDDDHSKMSLRTWVNVVYGKMTAIDRNRKCVIVNNETLVPYDHLVISTGIQYQYPMPNEADITKLVTTQEAPYSPDRRFQGEPPKNVFIVNDSYDAAVVLYWVENNILDKAGKAVVYGNTLDAFCCLQALLNMGITGDRLILVEPPQVKPTTCFNNPDIEQAVTKALQDAGIEVHSGYTLAQWNDGNDATEVYAASFTSNAKPLRLECAAFFSYYKKNVDYEAFKAINDACLVFDGKLVIDSSNHTNDVSIRGAGTVTKFQRQYHADQWTHMNFNSKEVGMQLANTMLSLFDPTLEPDSKPPKELLKLIPMFRAPKIQAGLLPGGFNYLHIGKPGLIVPLDAQMAQNDYGLELTTGTPGGETEYFRLHINQYSTIETVTCLSLKALPVSNLMCLYGIHQRYLNNLQSRVEEGLVKDFYSYFGETWCLAVYHDRFADFRDEIRELLVMRPSEDIEALEERVRHLVEEDVVINIPNRRMLNEEYVKTGIKRAVETRFLSFLSYNYYHLPMYAKPGMV